MSDTKRNSKEIAALLVAIARLGNNETHATYHPNGKAKYRPRAGTVSAEVITAHLNDQQPIGCYFILQDVTHTAIIDFDDHDGALTWQEMAEYAKPVIARLHKDGLKTLQCRSGGGAGLHAWMFWEKPQEAKLLRQYLNHIILECGFKSGTKGVEDKQVEIFPKSDCLKEGKLGNLIALPFARKSIPLDDDLHSIDWSDYNPPKLNELYSKDVSELYQPSPPKKEKPAKSKPAPVMAKAEYSAEFLPGDEGEVHLALQHIASDDYDLWIKMGFALKHAFGIAGFNLWDKWSSKSSAYDGLGKTREAWERLEPDGTLTIGTIFYHAQEAGWDGPSNKVIRELNSRFGILTHGNATRIIVKDFQGSEVLSLLGKTPFQDRLKPEKFPVTDETGNTRWREKSTYWLGHHLTAHYYEVIFDPSKPSGHNDKQWNTWRGFAVKPKEGDWSLLKQHIFDNICKGISERNDWFLNWLALGVQQPAYVIGTAPVLIGLPGTGKGVLANAYARLWHPHSISVTKDDHVSGRFNQHLEGRRFVLLDEAMFGGDRKNAGVIKTYMTESRIMIERKGIDPIWYDNHMIFMASSNERSVVPADIGDRRWQVFEVLPDKRDDKAYFSAIMKQLEDGGYEGMLNDLLGSGLIKSTI